MKLRLNKEDPKMLDIYSLDRKGGIILWAIVPKEFAEHASNGNIIAGDIERYEREIRIVDC